MVLQVGWRSPWYVTPPTSNCSCSHSSGTSASVLPQRHKVRAAKYRCRAQRTAGTRENMALDKTGIFFVGQKKRVLNCGRFFSEKLVLIYWCCQLNRIESWIIHWFTWKRPRSVISSLAIFHIDACSGEQSTSSVASDGLFGFVRVSDVYFSQMMMQW